MTTGMTVLAFDMGASSGRALVGQLVEDTAGHTKLQVTGIHRFPNHAIQVGDHLHWDILRLLHEMKKGIRLAFQKGYKPTTFGIDTWGVDFGLLDTNGELIGNPYHYRDSHTEGLIEEVNALIGQEALFQQSGLQFMPFNTLYQLYAMKKAASPKLDIAQTLLLTPDLLAYLLTGIKVCEFTMATTTQLYHPGNQTWNESLMEQLGIPSRLFLEPIHPGTIIGSLTPAVSSELGLQTDLQAVAVGTHDTESAIAAVPAGDEPFAYLVCGTWSLLGTEMVQPLLGRETMEMEFSNEGGVGGTYQLLKNIMGLWLLQECKREWDEQGNELSFPELVHMAEQAAPFRSIIYPDDPRFFAPTSMVDKIQEYCEETNQPIPQTEGEIIRCILESLALRYRQALEQAERLTDIRYSGLYMVGGGIQNQLLCQFTSNALGRPVWAGPIEASAIGNMLLQLIALGKCKNLQEARKLVSLSFPIHVYEPDSDHNWTSAYEKFLSFGLIQEERK